VTTVALDIAVLHVIILRTKVSVRKHICNEVANSMWSIFRWSYLWSDCGTARLDMPQSVCAELCVHGYSHYILVTVHVYVWLVSERLCISIFKVPSL